MTAGTKHLSIARALAHRYGNTAEARELADMLGLVDELGRIRPDDNADHILGFAAPKVGKRAREENPHAMDGRPKVSTAPEALRNLPPAPVSVVKPKRTRVGKPWTAEQRANLDRATAHRQAPHGTYTAARRHRRRGEPLCDLCATAKSTEPTGAARKTADRRRRGINARQLLPCGSEGAYRRHRAAGEECGECRDNHNARNRAAAALKRAAA